MRRKSLLLIPAILAFSLSSCDFNFFERQEEVKLTINETTIAVGSSLQLYATLGGSSEGLSWSSSNTSVATVSNTGVVTVVDDVNNVGKSVTITVEKDGAKGTCTVHIGAKAQLRYEYTIMIYMCGSSLEWDQEYYDYVKSVYGKNYADTHIDEFEYAASADIAEILSLDIPDSIRIVIETGGSTKWKTSTKYTQQISSNKLQRWEVKDKKLTYVCDSSNSTYMGDGDELQDFLSWGLKNYSATQMGVILWDHGAGIGGVCFDDNCPQNNVEDSYLTTSEVYKASSNALSENGREKFTWIGYDACLMNVADIASMNADNFEYMVAAQESEAGEGWAYDKWLAPLISNPSIAAPELLGKIAETFVSTIHSTYCSYAEPCLTTLSVLDLSKMPSFIVAFNNAISSYSNTSTTYNDIVSKMKQSLEFGYYEDTSVNYKSYNYGLVDLKSLFTNLGIFTAEMQTALNNLVIKNRYCSRMVELPCGLSVFVASTHVISSYSGYRNVLQVIESDYSGENATKLSKWQSIMLTQGKNQFYK